MKHATRLTTIFATLAAGIALAATAPAASALPPGGVDSQARGASVTIDRTSVKAGGQIKVTGKKWRSKGSRMTGKKEVTVKLSDRDILAVLPIRNRRFSGWVRIPKQVKPGQYWLRFLAAKPKISIASRRFRVR